MGAKAIASLNALLGLATGLISLLAPIVEIQGTSRGIVPEDCHLRPVPWLQLPSVSPSCGELRWSSDSGKVHSSPHYSSPIAKSNFEVGGKFGDEKE